MLFDDDPPDSAGRKPPGLKWVRAFDGRLYNVTAFGSFYVQTRSEAVHDKQSGRAVKKRVFRVCGHYGGEEVTLSHPFSEEDIAQKVLSEVFEFIDRGDKSTFDLMPFEIAVVTMAKLGKLLEGEEG